MKLNSIEKIVEKILIEDEESRKDDYYLMLKVLQEVAPEQLGKSYYEVLLQGNKRPVSFKSVERARRKVLNKIPELKDQESEDWREEKEQEYFEYSKHIPRID